MAPANVARCRIDFTGAAWLDLVEAEGSTLSPVQAALVQSFAKSHDV